MLRVEDLDLTRPDEDLVAELVAAGYDEHEAKTWIRVWKHRDPDDEPLE